MKVLKLGQAPAKLAIDCVTGTLAPNGSVDGQHPLRRRRLGTKGASNRMKFIHRLEGIDFMQNLDLPASHLKAAKPVC